VSDLPSPPRIIEKILTSRYLENNTLKVDWNIVDAKI
jgi:hypothetical protein